MTEEKMKTMPEAAADAAGAASFNTPTEELAVEIYDEMGIIGPQTKLTGNIVTKGHVTVLGSVKGDISASGNVIVKGTVKGKIICNNLLLENALVEADIEAKSQVSVRAGVTLKGRLDCGSASIMGTVLGSIKAADKVGLAESAVIRGDIAAACLGVAPGAKIEGKITVG